MPLAREIRLAGRPDGLPRPEHFDLVRVELPEPGPGEVLVRSTFMSVDPYMRPRMDDVPSYVAPFQLGAALDGPAVGEVIASGTDALAPGDPVFHWSGWRDIALCDARAVRRIDLDLAPWEAHLGVLGMTGFTAYVGLLDVAGLRDGDVLFVSGAAGAVGSVAGQIAHVLGHRVIGSAGSPEKVDRCLDRGFDAAIDYHAGPLVDALRAHAPGGIDVYFDNVGGEHLEAAIDVMNDFGRIAACGSISTYNDRDAAPGLRNGFKIVQKRLTIRGFIVRDHLSRWDDFTERVGGWLRDGLIQHDDTVVDGLERAPEAFIAMLQGGNVGKMLVRVG